MKAFRKLWDAITLPFQSLYVWIWTSIEENEDGAWDKYWRKRNRKDMKKAEKRGRS